MYVCVQKCDWDLSGKDRWVFGWALECGQGPLLPTDRPNAEVSFFTFVFRFSTVVIMEWYLMLFDIHDQTVFGMYQKIYWVFSRSTSLYIQCIHIVLIYSLLFSQSEYL